MRIPHVVPFLLLALCLFVHMPLHAQFVYGNEWIKENQPYYKLRVFKDGMYKVDYAAMQAAGLAGQSPAAARLYCRGAKVPVYVQNGGDTGRFDAGDYLLFYGQRNDGALDSALYSNPKNQPSRKFSLYSDTSIYFLTFDHADPVVAIEKSSSNPQTSVAPQTWYLHEAGAYFMEGFYAGKPLEVAHGYQSAFYSEGEGYLSATISLGGSRQIALATPFAHSGGPKPRLQIRLYGQSDFASVYIDHKVVIEIKADNNSFKSVTNPITFDGYRLIDLDIPLDYADLGQNTTVKISVQGNNGSTVDRIGLAYVKLTYGRNYKFAAPFAPFSFSTTNASQDAETFFKIGGFKVSANPKPPHFLYDITHGLLSEGFFQGDSLRFTVKNTGALSEYYVHDTLAIGKLSLSGPFSYNIPAPLTGANLLIISHSRLKASATEYANYKQSLGYFVALAYADQLYDIFFYGQHHPVALQRYLHHMYHKSGTKPSYLLLLGKGYDYHSIRFNSRRFGRDLVPIIGHPASDALYTAGLDVDYKGGDATASPLLAVGRISAPNDDSVRAYLDKLREWDNWTPQIWHKNFIHVASGDPGIQLDIEKDMQRYQKMLEGPYIGANVKAFYSRTSNVVNVQAGPQIRQWINSGASMYTYFGHGSEVVMGVDFGKAEELNNPGKYPVMFLNGCGIGNPGIADVNKESSTADNFLFVKNKGAIAWLSQSTTTFTSPLDFYITRFFRHLTNKSYGATLGNVWKETITEIDNEGIRDSIVRNIGNTWVLQGDPTLQLPFQALPDYATYADSLRLHPITAIASDDSFAIRIPFFNLGKATEDSFEVKVVRTFPDGNTITHRRKFGPVYNSRAENFYLYYHPKFKSQGTNHVDITIDPDYKVNESDKTNNSVRWTFFLSGNGVRQVYPTEYGIVGDTSKPLVMQSRNLLDTTSTVTIEVDTSHSFNPNSPLFLRSQLPTRSIINFHPWRQTKWRRFVQNLLRNKDTVTIFWRAKLNAPPGQGDEWETRSFTYISGVSDGWAQAHYHQYGNIEGEKVIVDTIGREFRFSDIYRNLILASHPYFRNSIGISDQFQGFVAGVCPEATIVAMEFDRQTLMFLYKNGGWVSCTGRRVYRQFNMRWETTPAGGKNVDKSVYGADSFRQFVKNVKKGNYVVFITRGPGQYFSNYSTSTIQAFQAIGAKSITTLTSSTKYDRLTTWLFAGKKGDPVGESLLDEWRHLDTVTTTDPNKLPTDSTEILRGQVSLVGPGQEGSMTSMVIGPAAKWQSIHNIRRPKEYPNNDTSFIYIYGLNKDGTRTLLDSTNLNSLSIGHISADSFPYLQLESQMKDLVSKTPPQLRLWGVMYDGLPEGTMLVDKNYLFQKAQMLTGDTLRMRVKFKNISPYPMDSLYVTYTLYRDGVKVGEKDRLLPPLLKDSVAQLTFDTATRSFNGNYQLIVFANPGPRQPEMSLDNNVLKLPFRVTGDVINPLLDVTFDGRHIMDGEIVSAKPSIVITDKDENEKRMLTDTNLIRVFLKRPGSSVADSIPVRGGEITFYPATDNGNRARLEYHPQSLDDGIHELRVQAYDEAGNKAGTNDYNITFQVINKSMVSNFYVYPNPFTTKARFVFTLTGSEVPDYMKVQIMTITGKVVKEITRDELGRLRIGQNITEYAWDGRDDYGDYLANGLYLYRVVVKENDGKTVDQYSTAGDKFFEKNFGKMYILR